MTHKNRSGPLAFLLVDGLRSTAEAHLINIRDAMQSGNMQGWNVQAARPTLSYPNYATIISGEEPSVHGLLNNKVRDRIGREHMLQKIANAGKIVAVVGFDWWRCLIGDGPWHLTTYAAEDTPDSWVYHQARLVATKLQPDFLLVHSLGVDYAGHLRGADSVDYLESARTIDLLIYNFEKFWSSEFGGKILVGSDHGMRGDRGHGGDSAEETNIRYYFNGKIKTEDRPLRFQSDIRRFIERYLGVDG